jgi:flagellin
MPTPLAIMTNMGSVAAQKNLSDNSASLQRSISRLSSGLRINSSADDAAGMAVSTGLRAQLRGYQQAQRNANDAVAIINTGEGGLNSISDTLIRMRELAVQAASDGLTNIERDYVQTEFADLQQDINRIAGATEYNGTKLLDGTAGASGSMVFQVGTRNGTNDQVKVNFVKMDTSALGVKATQVSTLALAQSAIGTIDASIATLSTHRATLGSKINVLSQASSNLGTTIENVSAGLSSIRDADMAQESAAFSSALVLQQAGVAMLAQANQAPNLALRLLI